VPHTFGPLFSLPALQHVDFLSHCQCCFEQSIKNFNDPSGIIEECVTYNSPIARLVWNKVFSISATPLGTLTAQFNNDTFKKKFWRLMVTAFLGKVNTERNNEGDHNKALAGFTLGEHKPAGRTKTEVSETLERAHRFTDRNQIRRNFPLYLVDCASMYFACMFGHQHPQLWKTYFLPLACSLYQYSSGVVYCGENPCKKGGDRAHFLSAINNLFCHCDGKTVSNLIPTIAQETLLRIQILKMLHDSVFKTDMQKQKLVVLLHHLAPSGKDPSVPNGEDPGDFYCGIYLARVGNSTNYTTKCIAFYTALRDQIRTTERPEDRKRCRDGRPILAVAAPAPDSDGFPARARRTSRRNGLQWPGGGNSSPGYIGAMEILPEDLGEAPPAGEEEDEEATPQAAQV